MEVDPELQKDSRWQLIERITASPAFLKSTRISDLLRFLAERTIRGQLKDLTEQRIGNAVLGKPKDYSVVEDSSVRVHVRQLRLKLHEYFDEEGRNETTIVEIPKGAYTAVFHTVEPRADTQPEVTAAPDRPRFWLQLLPWGLAALFLITTLAGWLRHPTAARQLPPWPLAPLFSDKEQVQLVVADANYGMMRLIDMQPITLEEYLSPAYRNGEIFSKSSPTAHEARVMKYLSSSLLSSYADIVVVNSLIRMSGDLRDLLIIRSARELRPRDLEEGNFIFVGSPSSNPWVFYFQDKLNFREREGAADKYFQNLHPKAGEQERYEGLASTGGAGKDYATISLLPVPNGHGSVLILQGLQQESTEAAGLFLADESNRQKLRKALGVADIEPRKPIYFEALICVQAFAGAPNTTSIVTTRVIPF